MPEKLVTSGGTAKSTKPSIGIKVLGGVPASRLNGSSKKFSASPESISSRTVTALSFGSPTLPSLTFKASSTALK